MNLAATPNTPFSATPTNGVGPLTVQFNSLSQDANNNTVVSWNWDFGDGATSTAQNPSHTYTNAGSYSPTLTVTNSNGDAILGAGPSITVLAPASVEFTASPNNGTAPLSVQFNSPGLDSNGNTITNWNWDFGDGVTSTVQNPSHVYATAGSFTPTLTATDNLGGAVTGSGPSINVSPAPTVLYTADQTNGTAPLTVQFTASDTDSAGETIMSWNWDFGDGSTSPQQNPSHTYSATGSFAPVLVATNDLGETVYGVGPSITVSTPQSPGPMLVAYYTFDDGNLSATDFSGNGNDLGYPFDFGGGSANITGDALAGPDAVLFDNNGGAGGAYYYISTSNLLSTLTGSFSISLWLKTAQVSGSDSDSGLTNAGIVSTYSQTVVPMALTGDKLAFVTDSSSLDVLQSAAPINTGSYVHLVVTRDQATGEKKIYINGGIDASDFGETGTLNDPTELDVGSGNGYGLNGELDDIQIYSGVLSADEVMQLYQNPGTTITDTSGPPPPITVSVELQIERYDDLDAGLSDFEVFPYITFVDPPPLTTNRLESPDGQMFSEVFAGDSYNDNEDGEFFTSLDDAIQACTNSQWTLYINQGDASERVFHFNISVSALTTNLMSPVTVLVPAPDATGVPTNSAFQWSGPANFNGVFVESYQEFPSFVLDGYASLSGTATNWPSPPALPAGTNFFLVQYTSNSFPNITFTTPVDANTNSIADWSSDVDLFCVGSMSFVVGGSAPAPVRLIPTAQQMPGSLQFSFQTHAGLEETIQGSTNLAVWTDLTNFVGDGSLQQFAFSTTNASAEFFRVKTQ